MENKLCKKCGTNKPISEFNFTGLHQNGKRYKQSYCKSCYAGINLTRVHLKGITHPMHESKRCSLYLGVCVAEKALSTFFQSTERMPHGNKGFDFLCGRKFKIDVKSGCFNEGGRYWGFHINKNIIADYFLCLAFNNRDDLNPQHVWLIPGNLISHLTGLSIRCGPKSLSKWSEYERPLDKVIACCSELREGVHG